MLTLILIVSLIGAFAGIAGGVFLLTKEAFARKVSVYFVAFATGTLLANAFLQLLPEAMEIAAAKPVMIAALAGLLLFLVLEKLLVWYHCHDGTCDVHDPDVYKYTVTIGDTLHNFLDGIAIALAFLIDVRLGFATAVAVFAHEIPQEIGDFGILLHSGLSRGKVLAYNVVSALATPLGALAGFFMDKAVASIEPFVLAFVAGNFIYVAAADLIPHLQREFNWRSSFVQVVLAFLGVALVAFI